MSEFKTIETQEELDAIVNERLAGELEQFSDYDVLKTKAADSDSLSARVKELEKEIERSNQTISEHERQIEGYQSQISGYKTEKMRQKIANQYGLPLDLASRLQGESEDDLKADAENLAALLSQAGQPAPLKDSEPNLKKGSDAAYKALAQNINIED